MLKGIFLRIILILLLFAATELYAKDYTLVFNNYPPYEYSTNNGVKGLSVDKIKKVFGQLGHTVHFKHAPWSRALKMAKSHEVDGIFSLFKTKERTAYFVYPDTPLFKSRDLLISRADSNVVVKKFDDLKKYKIGVIKDNSHGKKFDSMKLNKEYSMSTEIPLLRKLMAKRLDLIVCTEKVFYYYIKDLKLAPEKFIIQPLVVNTEDLYLALSKNLPNIDQLSNSISKELKSLRK